MKLTKDAKDAPTVREAQDGAMLAKHVCVLETVDGKLQPIFDEGERAVVAVGSATAELTTTNTIGGSPGHAGTYVTPADFAALPGAAKPTIRKYRWKDTWAKIRSRGGALLLAGAAVAAVTAVIGFWFTGWGESGTSAGDVAAQGQGALRWAAEAATPAAREQRAIEVDKCLAELRGDDGPKAKIPGVDCTPSKPNWIHDKDNEALLTGILGLVSVLLTGLGLRDKFGFGKDPGD